MSCFTRLTQHALFGDIIAQVALSEQIIDLKELADTCIHWLWSLIFAENNLIIRMKFPSFRGANR